MSKARVRKLERDLDLDEWCVVCEGVPPTQTVWEYVHPDDLTTYSEPQPAGPCPGCGRSGVLVVYGRTLPFLKRPGEDEATGRSMTDREAATYWDGAGVPHLASWFRSRAAEGVPQTLEKPA